MLIQIGGRPKKGSSTVLSREIRPSWHSKRYLPDTEHGLAKFDYPLYLLWDGKWWLVKIVEGRISRTSAVTQVEEQPKYHLLR